MQDEILERFTPSKLLQTKYYTILAISLILLNGLLFPLLYAISMDPEFSFTVIIQKSLPWILGIELPMILLVIILIPLYYRSIHYELTTHEIIVYKGIITKSKKLVPYRNITNFNEKRGLLDRIIGGQNFGTIVIETAGMSGQSQPEQRLEGIQDIQKYTEKIRGIVKKMKGTAGISADAELSSALSEEEVLKQILETLKRIEKKI